MTNNQQVQQTQQSTQKATPYWLPLYSFYADKATMTVTLADSDGNVQFKISPVIPGKEGRPQAGQQKYDYQNSVAITLSVAEMSSIIMSYNLGSINQTPASFYHKTQNGAITGGLGFYEGRFYFNINDQARSLNHKYYFNFSKFGQQGSEVYIPGELNLLINIMQGILTSLPLIKAKLFPAYVPKTQNTQQTQQNSHQQPVQQQNAGYQQPAPQPSYQQPAVQSNVGGYQQPAPQPSYQQPVQQQNTFNGGGLPQSTNDPMARAPQPNMGQQSQEFDF